MKENRLIELLDEYDSVQYHEINHKIENWSIYRNVWGTDGWYEVWRYCKQFWFIKRLVDNDKIDLERILKENWQFRLFYYDLERVKNYDRLVMYLSVEDNPIEFLVSILK